MNSHLFGDNPDAADDRKALQENFRAKHGQDTRDAATCWTHQCFASECEHLH
jgi:hypothetical protein